MKRINLIVICFLVFLSNYVLSNEKEKYLKIREIIFNSFLKRNPDSIYYKDEEKSKKWNYEQGLILEAFHQLWIDTKDESIINYIKKNLDYYIDSAGNIRTYKLADFNLDNIVPGRACLFMYDITQDIRYKIAADTLRKQLKYQPRTNEGGFWHKKIYPYQMWLDGLYMAEPFYAHYSKISNDTTAYDDIVNQFVFIYNHTYDEKTGLLYHGWDESKTQKWAHPEKGTSPNFWGRAIGWYLMGIVDVLDFLPETYSRREELITIFKNVTTSLVKYRDKKYKLWYQVVNYADKKGNYIETSASAMYIYAFIKGVNKGYLKNNFAKLAIESFESMIKHFTQNDKNGNIDLLNVCQVSGLGGNPYRDGSYEYYISEPKRINDFKGYGPFMLSSIEIVRYFDNKEKIKVLLDYYFNHEIKNGKQYHYVWEDTTNSGFSQFGDIIKNNNGLIFSLKTAPTIENLKNYNIYIIVDPDTEKETDNPNYIDDQTIKVITKWVKEGGVFLVFANDSGNCEFNNLNKLTSKFGIIFNGDSKNRVAGKDYEIGAFTNLPNHDIFTNVKKIFLKEISTLTLKKPAKPILVKNTNVIIAIAKYGKGLVFAVGDPWFYNEYMDCRRLPEEYENKKAADNLIKYLFNKCKQIKK